MTDADAHEPLPAADASPAMEEAGAVDPHDAGPGPVPERAMRRVRRGLGLGTLAAVAVVASTSVGIGTHLALSEAAQAPALPPATPAPELPDPVDLDEVRVQLTALATELDEARLQKLSATGDEMQKDLAAALPKLMLEIRVARDARLKRGDRKRLAGPFTANELDGVLATVRATPKGDRLVTDRDGNIVAPAGKKAPGIALAANGTSAAVKVWTLGEGRALTLVARRCLVKEKHCLVELRDVEVPTVDVSSSNAALDRAGVVDAALRDAVAVAATPAPTTAHSPRSAAPVVAGGLAGLLAALALAFFVRRQLRAQSAAVAGYASAIAAGSDATPPRRTAGELVGAVEALLVVARRRDDDRAQAADEQERRERWSAWSSQLDRVAEGALDARLAPSGDALEISVAEGVNRVVASLDQRVAQLQRHLTALAPNKASSAALDDAPADDSKDTLHKRIEAIRPLAGLLGDIGTRLKALAAAAEEGTALQRDLARLGDAVGTRAKTAAGLVSALEHDIGQLEQPSMPGAGGLSTEAQQALVALTADLDALGVAPSLAHQLAAEGRFTWAA